MPYQAITDFSGGLNYIVDARKLKPNSSRDQTAELQEAINVDINKEGAVITSRGYELFSENIGVTGGVQAIYNYEKDADNRYLAIVHDNNLYSVTPSVTTWNSEGSLGSAATKWGFTHFVDASETRKLIIGNNNASNTLKKFDGSSLANLGSTDPNGSYILDNFLGRLLAAKDRNIYYSEVGDDSDFGTDGGFIAYDDIVTGMAPEGDRLHAFTRTYNQPMLWQYDDNFNIATPYRDPFLREYGAMSYRTITRRGANVRYWGDDNRIYNLGAESAVDEQGLPRPMHISEKISPFLQLNNLGNRDVAKAVSYRRAEQWWLSVPFGNVATNNLTWVYNERWKAWTQRTGFIPSDLALFRDSNYQEQLYFSSALAPEIYKFNDSYTYAGAGYLRQIKTKKFTMGDASLYKHFAWIDLAGSMYNSTIFYVKVRVDSNERVFQIDNSNLEGQQFTDGYWGDSYWGEIFQGGQVGVGELEGSGFRRFRAHIHLPSPIREGAEIEITIYNSAAGQPWKIDFLGIEYDEKPRKQRNPNFIVNTIVAG